MRYLLVFLLAIGFYCAKAQTTSDSVYVAKNFLGYKYYQNNMRLNFNQLPYVMEENSEAYPLISKAKSNYTTASILGGLGGFLVGWQLGTAIFGGNPNWALAGVGGALIVVSIPINSKAINLAFEAIDLYNSGISNTSRRRELNIGITGNGLGLIVKF